MDDINNLAKRLSMLPGIGKKTATRLAYSILNWDDEKAFSLADAITQAKKNVKYCPICCNYTSEEVCPICKDETRDRSTICVVTEPRDVNAIEKTGYKGLYHVLGGVISPINGIGPDDIRLSELMSRLTGDLKEVILAVNLSVEGEATSSYIARLIKPFGIKVTRIARGIPTGADLEYADEATLTGAIEARRLIEL